MKIIGVIPARYSSSRLPGKPLADICGKPMIWWVYNRVSKVKELENVYIATDDKRIVDVCNKYDMNVVLTSEKHATHLDRLSEFAEIVKADFYINVNGDEPLIEESCIRDLLPVDIDPESDYAANGMMIVDNPVDAIDTSKGKIVTDTNGYGMYVSRYPIPYPKGSSDYKIKKFVGVQCFTKKALAFCGKTPRGPIERIEDCDEFRFLENGYKLKFIMTHSTAFAVDTQKDLDRVRTIIEQTLKKKQA
jgi:3-deoxy-manno-octulosonate cytidylyltransferase (CMP-KDO synthetase)